MEDKPEVKEGINSNDSANAVQQQQQQQQQHRISLNDQLFEQSIKEYIDNNKPDQLSLKQINGWKLEWSNKEGEGTTTPTDLFSSFMDDDDDDDGILAKTTTTNTSQHYIYGTLKISSEYVNIILDIVCIWSPSPTKPIWGSLYYVCIVQGGEFVSAANKEDKATTKIIQRLKQDDYIKYIITVNNNKTATKKNNTKKKEDEECSSTSPSKLILAKAKIKVDESNLEERVHVSEKLCESIRRSIWSATDTPLDIIDLIVNLPCLPTSHTPLASRAKLRLLEDAMCDACEQEGEDELIEDLNISTKEGGDKDDDDEEEEEEEGRQNIKKRRKK